MISNRVQALGYSAIRKLLPLAQEAKDKGKEVIHLNMGVPDSNTPEEYFEAIRKYDTQRLSYAPSNGVEELKKAISKYFKNNYQLSYTPDEIIVTSGASEALQMVLFSICDEKDRILTTNPYYSNYQSYLDQLDIQLDVFETELINNYALPDTSVIEAQIQPNTRAILICNPSNPTGKVLNQSEVEKLVEIAIKNNLYIIADEIYRDFIFDQLEFISFGEYKEIENQLILIDSVSKRFSACGARLGAILCKNQKLMLQISKLAASRLAVPTLEQIGGIALYQDHSQYLAEVKQQFQERRDIVYQLLSGIQGVQTYKPEGAFYVMARLPVKDADEFAEWLLTDFDEDGQTVMVAPASGFYKNGLKGHNEIRIAFAVDEYKLVTGIELLEKGLIQYQETTKIV